MALAIARVAAAAMAWVWFIVIRRQSRWHHCGPFHTEAGARNYAVALRQLGRVLPHERMYLCRQWVCYREVWGGGFRPAATAMHPWQKRV